MFTEEQVKGSINSVERQLLWDIRNLLIEQNELLRKSLEGKNADPIDELKRPELMKRMAKLDNRPPGWNKWETEAMRKFLKEAS